MPDLPAIDQAAGGGGAAGAGAGGVLAPPAAADAAPAGAGADADTDTDTDALLVALRRNWRKVASTDNLSVRGRGGAAARGRGGGARGRAQTRPRGAAALARRRGRRALDAHAPPIPSRRVPSFLPRRRPRPPPQPLQARPRTTPLAPRRGADASARCSAGALAPCAGAAACLPGHARRRGRARILSAWCPPGEPLAEPPRPTPHPAAAARSLALIAVGAGILAWALLSMVVRGLQRRRGWGRAAGPRGRRGR
jgi:hypothetical protein